MFSISPRTGSVLVSLSRNDSQIENCDLVEG
jgi:hypothetical protein